MMSLMLHTRTHTFQNVFVNKLLCIRTLSQKVIKTLGVLNLARIGGSYTIELTRMSEEKRRHVDDTYSLLWKMVKGKGRRKKEKEKEKERPAGDGYKCVSTREGCGSWGVTLPFCRIKGCGCAVLCCIPVVTHRCYCCNKYRKKSIPDPFSCLSRRFLYP